MDLPRPSKTRRKKEMEELQEIGAALVALPRDTLNKFDLPDNLKHEVLEAKNISQNGAKRRQLQFIGKIMRSVEVEPIRTQLEQLEKPSASRIKRLHETEEWREKIINTEENLKYFIEHFPLSDINELKLLVADCRGEITRNSKGSFKKLFKIISTSLEKSSG